MNKFLVLQGDIDSQTHDLPDAAVIEIGTLDRAIKLAEETKKLSEFERIDFALPVRWGWCDEDEKTGAYLVSESSPITQPWRVPDTWIRVYPNLSVSFMGEYMDTVVFTQPIALETLKKIIQ